MPNGYNNYHNNGHLNNGSESFLLHFAKNSFHSALVPAFILARVLLADSVAADFVAKAQPERGLINDFWCHENCTRCKRAQIKSSLRLWWCEMKATREEFCVSGPADECWESDEVTVMILEAKNYASARMNGWRVARELIAVSISLLRNLIRIWWSPKWVF